MTNEEKKKAYESIDRDLQKAQGLAESEEQTRIIKEHREETQKAIENLEQESDNETDK